MSAQLSAFTTTIITTQSSTNRASYGSAFATTIITANTSTYATTHTPPVA